MVEIDKLIAAQRTVNLDYVNRLVTKYPKEPTLDELLDICVSPKREMEPIQHLEVGRTNTHVFSSPNSDVRFLGAFVKQLAHEDLEHAVFGGLPAAAVIAFVGYGGAPINVFICDNRVVLNNGFHRVFALRSMGVAPSTRVYQGLPDIDYPLHDKTIVVTRCGRICLGKKKINFSQVFAGQAVGIKEVHDDIWLGSFMDYDLGYFDLETRVLEPLENPFGPKVLPMS